MCPFRRLDEAIDEMRLGSDEHKRLSMLRYIACAPMYYRTQSVLRYLHGYL